MPVKSPPLLRLLPKNIIRAGLPAALAIGLFPLPPTATAKDFPSWKNQEGSAAFVLSDGTITSSPLSSHSGEALLIANDSVRDFILEFEFRQDPGAPAAAIEFRRRDPAGPGSGYRCSLTGTGYAGPGALSEPAGRGWLYPLTLNPAAPAAFHAGEWNRFRIEAIGPSIRTWVNGQPIAHLIDDTALEGRLALCLSSLSPSETIGARNYWRAFHLTTSALRPSPAAPVFARNFLPNQLSESEQAQSWRLLWDGSTTAGWRGAHRPAFPTGGWRIDHGELILSSIPEKEKRLGGDLVTEELFSAFEFQFDFLLTPGANSGVKYFVTEDFKPASGITAIGLEFQLLDDERHPDAKHGTDGNRKLASLYDIIPATPPPNEPGLLPVIGQWQHARIVVHPDQHVEHWLNGVKVVDYVRGSPAFNEAVARSAYAKFPRFGLAEAGRLLLQDHGDEVHFRSLKVRSLPPRDKTQNPIPSP